jgi:hypothetical protein
MRGQIPILAMATNGVLLSNLRPLSIGLLISSSVHIYICGVEWGGVGRGQAAWSNPIRHLILRTQSNQCTSPKDRTWSTTAVNWPVTCPWKEIIEFGKGDDMPMNVACEVYPWYMVVWVYSLALKKEAYLRNIGRFLTEYMVLYPKRKYVTILDIFYRRIFYLKTRRFGYWIMWLSLKRRAFK